MANRVDRESRASPENRRWSGRLVVSFLLVIHMMAAFMRTANWENALTANSMFPLTFDRHHGLRRVKEFPHGWSGGGVSGELGYAEAFDHEAEDALMLVECDGFVRAFGKRADDDSGYVAATGSEVEVVGFVKDDNEQAVVLKLRAVNQRVDVGLEPDIGGAERAVVRVIAKIGDDEGIVGEVDGVQIGSELSEGHEVLHLRGIVLRVGEIGERIVADGVAAHVVAGVADRWKILGVGLPGFAGREEDADDVVCVDGETVRRDGIGETERRESLSGGELEIVWARGMCVCEVVCRKTVLVGKGVQVGHRGISDDVTVIGVFLDDNEDVAKRHTLTGRRRGVGYLSDATGQC